MISFANSSPVYFSFPLAFVFYKDPDFNQNTHESHSKYFWQQVFTQDDNIGCLSSVSLAKGGRLCDSQEVEWLAILSFLSPERKFAELISVQTN